MIRLFHLSIATSVVVLTVVGCNTILDNEPGTLLVTSEAGTFPPPGEPPSVPGDVDSGTPSPERPAPEADSAAPRPAPDAGEPCPTGQQRCAGSCVSSTDPLHGCGDPSCTPCPTDHSTMACQGRKCVIAKCDGGFADCNANAADGCESDLSKATSCGGCNAVCGAVAPLCAPNGPSFQCTNGCAPTAPLKCDAVCVDPMTSTNHCGGCGAPCANVANAVSACTMGVCSATCKPTFHACAGARCAADADVTACGAACTPCAAPAGGAAACTAGACQTVCPAGTHLCAGRCAADADVTACGAACTACPVPAGGAASCVTGLCRSTCPAGTHGCAGACVADSSVAACGAACTVCPVPANGSAVCAGGACGVTCSVGFGNCDADAANGCETVLATDPARCGSCATACAAGQQCVAGLCL